MISKHSWRNKLPDAKVSHGKFCDYCKCDSCQNGLWSEKHAQRLEVEDGSHICTTCFYYEPWEGCESAEDDLGCKDFLEKNVCEHRPRLKQ